MADAGGLPRSPGSRTAPRAGEETIRRLLRTQVPALADLALRPGPTGWDNTHWRLGADLAVRLPRRRSAVALVANEVAALAVLAPRLPLPVPVPVHVGEPGEGWPWPWTIVPWFAGARADADAGTDRPARAVEAHAAALGGFLRTLHVPAPDDAPHNPYRSIPLQARDVRTAGAIDVLAERGAAPGMLHTLRRVWAAGLDAPAHAGPRVWIHGDLHPGNQLVAGGRLVAVVDWGDVAGGDPAADLATAWWTLPPAAHAAFWAAYGLVEVATTARAAAWAAAIAAYILKEGPAVGDPALVAMAERTVARLQAAG